MSQPRGLTFPVEIWRKIFDNVTRIRDRATLTLICRALSDEAQAVLLENVVLKKPQHANHFYITLRRFPRRAAHVKRFYIRAVTFWDVFRVPIIVEPLFELLTAVRDLVLDFDVGAPQPRDHFAPVLVLNPKWFPHLQTLSTPLPFVPSLGMKRFVEAHAGLRELHVAHAYDSMVAGQKAYAGTNALATLPALRVLACQPTFLFEHVAAAGARSLTHLNLHRATPSMIDELAVHYGGQLISLRLTRPAYENAELWAVPDFMAAFPRLSFLHIDIDMGNPFMEGSRRDPLPFVNPPLIDWLHRPTAVTAAAEDAPSGRKLTVAWAYAASGGGNTFGLRDHLCGFAAKLLDMWGDRIENVLLFHHMGPGQMLSVRADGGLLSVQTDRSVCGWKYV